MNANGTTNGATAVGQGSLHQQIEHAAQAAAMLPAKPPPSQERPLSATDQLMLDAVQAKLVEVASQKPMTPRTLFELERITTHARALLLAALSPTAMGRQNHPHLGMGNVYNYGTPIVIESTQWGTNPGYDAPITGSALAPSSGPENFGAQVIRELTSIASAFLEKQSKRSATDLILAINTARGCGMADLAEKLEAELLATEETPALPATEGKAGAPAVIEMTQPTHEATDAAAGPSPEAAGG